MHDKIMANMGGPLSSPPPQPDPIAARVLDALKEYGTYERHFNQLQSFYRSLASTWLLAAFTGIGFVLTKTTSLPTDPWCLVMAIGIAGGVGLFLLWILDMVYHSLLVAVYDPARRLEEQFQFVPGLPLYRIFFRAPVGKMILFFYLVGISTLWEIAMYAWTMRTRRGLPVLAVVLVPLVLAIVMYVFTRWKVFGHRRRQK